MYHSKMGRAYKDSTIQGDYATANLYLLRNRPADKYQLKLRLTVRTSPVLKLDTPVVYHDKTWRFSESEFNPNLNAIRAGSMTNGHLMAFNQFIFELLHKAVAIGDNVYHSGSLINHADFRTKLYDESLKEVRQLEQIGEKKFYQHQRDNEKIVEGERIDYEKPEYVANYKNKELRKNKSTKEIYAKKLFNPRDIFEVFGALLYPNPETGKPIANSGTSIVIRLMQYRTLAKPTPSRNVADFNDNWIKKFLTYMFENGYVSTKKMTDPLKFDPAIFEGATIPCETSSKQKYYKQIKRVANELIKAKYLPDVNLKVTFKDVIDREENKAFDETPRTEQQLHKPELDRMLFANIADKELALVRDQFIFMTMLGGLRINEFNDTNVIKDEDGYGNEFFAYEVSKQTKPLKMKSPVNGYLSEVLKRHKGKIPYLTKGEIDKTVEGKFNANLKRLAEHLDLRRTVAGKIRDKETKEWIHGRYPIMQLFSSLFARHTMVAVLDHLKVHESERNYFVGHRPRKGTQSSYNPKYYTDYMYKADIIKQHGLKPEKK